MEWNAQQSAVLDGVAKWFKEKSSQWKYVGGYAGTGKSTLAKYFAEGIGGGVSYAAYTGKAARVMRNKGCEDATTIHRLIYKPKIKPEVKLKSLIEELEKVKEDRTQANRIRDEIKHEKQPSFALNEDAEIRHAKLVILDECSMVSGRLAQDLLSFGVPILVLGDPAQLPPVKGAGFFTSQKPDFFLDQIHRQAEGSEVLRLATAIRKGLDPEGPCVIDRKDLTKEMIFESNQVLTGKNQTRRMLNQKMRKMKGFSGKYPIKGDKLVCLKNDYEAGLLNGSILFATDDAEEDGEDFVLGVRDEDTEIEQDVLSVKQQFERYDNPDFDDHRSYFDLDGQTELDFAYALTVHKSQGSQWKNVIICDDGFGWRNSQTRNQWLYTAVTRAEEKVTVVKGFK